MNRLTMTMFVILTLFSAVGCNSVLVEEPVGAEPVRIEPDEWEGYWIGQSQQYGNGHGRQDGDESLVGYIDVVDAENGVINVTWLNEGNVRVTRIYLRQSGDWTFASVLTRVEDMLFGFGQGEQIDPSDETLYWWVRFSKVDRSILFWEPDVEKFSHLVADGLIPGRVDRNEDVFLGRLEPVPSVVTQKRPLKVT